MFRSTGVIFCVGFIGIAAIERGRSLLKRIRCFFGGCERGSPIRSSFIGRFLGTSSFRCGLALRRISGGGGNCVLLCVL